MRASTPRLLMLFALMPLHAQAARWVTLADIGIGSDDNIQAARDGLAQRDAQWLQAGVSTSFSEALDEGLSLRLQARLDGRLHAEIEGLNELSGGVDGQLLLRPGRGFYAPTMAVSMGIGSSQFQSGLRDAQEARAKLTVREALTTRLSTRGSLFTLWRGSSSQAFDTHIKGGELALDWQAGPALLLTLGYQYRDGRVVSIGMPGAAARANAAAIEADDVFAGQSAFSFDAQTHIGLVSASYALTPRLSLDAALRYVESDTGFNSRYHRWMSLTGLVLRF